MKKQPCLWMLVLLLAAGCKKSTSSASQQSRFALLTKSQWTLTKQEERRVIGGTSTPWTDYLAGAAACEKDNHLVFKTNMSAEANEGPLPCAGRSPYELLATTTWALVNNDNMLELYSRTHTIEELSETTLVITHLAIGGSGDIYKKWTYTR